MRAFITCALGALLTAAPSAHAQYDLEIIARVADEAPGTGGETFANLSGGRAYLSDTGRLLFRGGTGAALNPRLGLWTWEDDEIALVTRVGEQAPGFPGGVTIGDPSLLLLQFDGALDAEGRMVVYAPLDGSGIEHNASNTTGTPVNNSAVFSEQNGALRLHVQSGRLLVPGFVFPSGLTTDLHAANPADGAFNNEQIVLLSGRFVYCCNNNGTMLNSPGVHLAVRDPFGAEEQIVFAFDPFAAGPMPGLEEYEMLTLDGTDSPPVINPAGQVAFVADGELIEGNVRNSARCVFRADTPTDVQNLACQITTDSRQLRRPRHLTINVGGQVAFFGELPNGLSGQGIWVLGGAAPEAVARVGDSTPEGGTYTAISDFALLDDGRVVFLATASDGKEGVWMADSTGLVSLVRTGDAAPGTPDGVTFADVVSVAVNNDGRIAMMARVTGPGINPSVNDRGLWSGDVEGLSLVVRERDAVQVAPGEDAIVRQLDVRNMFSTPNSPSGVVDGPVTSGRPTHFNANGDIVFGAFLGTNPSSPDYVLIVASSSLVVNTTGDQPDANPGDEVCDTGGAPIEDRPPCTFRAAIEEANAKPGKDRITFDIPETDPGFNGLGFYIRPESDLPEVTDDVDLEGSTTEFVTTKTGGIQQEKIPQIVVDGGDPRLTRGLQFPAGDRRSGMRNLAFIRFPQSAVLIGRDNFVVEGCWFGLDLDGRPAPNRGDGIQIQHARGVRIGGDAERPGTGKGNRFANNRTGVLIFGEQARENLVQGNYFTANDLHGVYIVDGSRNFVGGEFATQRNVIVGHNREESAGVRVEGIKADVNRIEGNYIGLEEDGVSIRRNTRGVHLIGTSQTAIGGTTLDATKSQGNVISGNRDGIVIEGPAGEFRTRIEGNIIGLTAGGDPVPHVTEDDRQRHGILIKGGWVIVGIDRMSGLRFRLENVISGNVYGVVMTRSAQEVHIGGNYIGTDVTGRKLIPNSRVGVQIEGRGHSVGSYIHPTLDRPGPPFGNVISGNKVGIEVLPGSNGIRIRSNIIGLDASQESFGPESPVANEVGIRITDASATLVGGKTFIFDLLHPSTNVIAGNDTAVVIVGRASLKSVIDRNLIGLNSKRESRPNHVGLFIRNAEETALYDNVIAHAPTIGVELISTRKTIVEENQFVENAVGASTVDAHGDRFIANIFEKNRAGLLIAEGSDVVVRANVGIQNGGGNTTIHVDASRAEITGNQITEDEEDAIVLENGAEALISGNNIFDNQGFGLRNTSSSVLIPSRGNWWGDASGPGGAGPGTGDEVSDGIDFSAWLTEPVSLVVSAVRDTLFLNPGRSDTTYARLHNWTNPTAVVDVTLSDEQGWVTGPAAFSVELDDTTGARVAIPLSAPGGAGDGTANLVTVTAASQDEPNEVRTDSFVALAYVPVLREIRVLPDTARLVPGETASFAALGFDQQGGLLNPTVTWTATGGEITPEGLYTAGGASGDFLVNATDQGGGLTGTAVVRIGSAVAAEDARPGLPAAFALHQSYPNPFNPRAVIPYDVKESARVVLKVYDVLGRQVSVLVDGAYGPGRYEVAFDAGGLPSGVYFYTVEMGSFRKAGMMILAK